MSSPGLLLADALLPLVGHTVHWTLTFGGLLALAALLVAARPGRAAPVRRPAEARRRQLALLATATAGPTERCTGVTGVTGGPEPVACTSTWLLRRPPPRRTRGSRSPWSAVRRPPASTPLPDPSTSARGCWSGGSSRSRRWASWAGPPWSCSADRRGDCCCAALVANAAVVALWLVTRTVGLPGGLVEVEPVGPWDVAATTWELALVAGVSLVLGSARFADNGARGVDIVRWSAAARAWLLVSVTLMAVLTVAGTSG